MEDSAVYEQKFCYTDFIAHYDQVYHVDQLCQQRGKKTVTQTFGKLIRQARKDKGLSQRELAKFVDVNYTYLSKLENDHAGTPPSEDVIERLALHLELQAQDLKYLAGRISEDDAKAFEEFVKQNYQQMPVLFRKMRDNPKFAQKFLQQATHLEP
jgi:transcriptional regulator with XRE-family HTH domain